MRSEGAGTEFAMLELARMKAAGMKQRRQDDRDIDATLIVLAEELAGYSQGVVKGACRDWARANEWWPSLAELRRSCEELAAAERRYERPRLPPAPVASHRAIVDGMEGKCGWLGEWRLAGGGERPCAVKREREGGPITAVRWSPRPDAPWHPVGSRRNEAEAA